MQNTFTSNDTDLSSILGGISSGKVQLPDFQREWVWDDHRIQALILSIMNGYPVGALMFLEYGGDSARFKYRPLTGSSADCEPEILVLDGQQRTTSVFTSLFCKDPVPTHDEKGKEVKRFYYLDISKCLDNDLEDRQEAILSLPENKQIRSDFGRKIELDLSAPEKEYEKLVFPLNQLFDNTGWVNWIAKCNEYHNYEKETAQLLTLFQTDVLVPLQSYKVPVITLGKETPKEAVCQVFENVNTGGVSLTVFELVTASFAADNFDLREDWEGDKKKDKVGRHGRMVEASAILNSVSATDFLTALTLLARFHEAAAGGRAVSCKKKDVLALQLDEYKKWADCLESGFVQAANFLCEQRIFTSRDLPYSTQLIPLSVIFSILGSRANDSTVRSKISQWYWCGVLGEMYGAANETRYVNDVTGMSRWISDAEDIPETISRAYFQPTRLLSLQTRSSAAYKGVMALILKHGAEDFISGTPMDFTNFTEQSVDIHHIFPKDYCIKQGYPKQKWNSIVNKTPLSASTNRIIGGAAPSEYMARIERDDHVTATNLKKFIATHAIDPSLMQSNDFDDFFIQRAKSLVGMIGDAMGKAVTNLDGEDVVEAFGCSLG